MSFEIKEFQGFDPKLQKAKDKTTAKKDSKKPTKDKDKK